MFHESRPRSRLPTFKAVVSVTDLRTKKLNRVLSLRMKSWPFSTEPKTGTNELRCLLGESEGRPAGALEERCERARRGRGWSLSPWAGHRVRRAGAQESERGLLCVVVVGGASAARATRARGEVARIGLGLSAAAIAPSELQSLLTEGLGVEGSKGVTERCR